MATPLSSVPGTPAAATSSGPLLHRPDGLSRTPRPGSTSGPPAASRAATGVPEKFAGLPLGTRATQLPDGEVNHVFLKTFGQPARELACECEREGDSNLAQALQLINGPTINDKVRNPNNRLGKLLAQKAPYAEILNNLYLATLSRLPAQGEVKAALEHVAKATDNRRAWEDVQWALLNSKEFLFRH